MQVTRIENKYCKDIRYDKSLVRVANINDIFRKWNNFLNFVNFLIDKENKKKIEEEEILFSSMEFSIKIRLQ